MQYTYKHYIIVFSRSTMPLKWTEWNMKFSATDWFIKRKQDPCGIRVEFATVAIGIGVNIPEVRHVIHLEVPRMLEL